MMSSLVDERARACVCEPSIQGARDSYIAPCSCSRYSNNTDIDRQQCTAARLNACPSRCWRVLAVVVGCTWSVYQSWFISAVLPVSCCHADRRVCVVYE